MTTEEKNLLLKDLSARVYYGVECKTNIVDHPVKLATAYINGNVVFGVLMTKIDKVKPYLFPLSSMTKEQIIEFNQLGDLRIGGYPLDNESYAEPTIYSKTDSSGKCVEICEYDIIPVVDWLNSHHFDYRGLIEKGLAIDATGLNIY